MSTIMQVRKTGGKKRSDLDTPLPYKFPPPYICTQSAYSLTPSLITPWGKN